MKLSLVIIFLITAIFSTCQKEHTDIGKTPILEVNGQILYEEDLPKNLFRAQSKEDSAKIVDGYIKRWVTER